ncbi:MAG: hypothetical protein RIS35_1677 [Pseudomonadota bacterium]|jgi:two-component system sensor histidine kinase TctE
MIDAAVARDAADQGRRSLARTLQDLWRTSEDDSAQAERPEAGLAPSQQAPTDERPVNARSLFGEILDWMLAPLLLLWPLSIGLTFVVARSLADAPFDRNLSDQANVLAQQVQVVDDQSAIVRHPRPAELLPPDSSGSRAFQIQTADGMLLAGDDALPPPDLYDFPSPGVVKRRTEPFRGTDVRIAYTHVSPPDDYAGSAFPVLIQVAETLDERTSLANEIIKGVIFPQFLILPVAVGLVWLALTRGLAPLRQMQDRIRQRRPDDLSPIDPRGAPEEIAPLVEALNDLLGRLRAGIQAQKRFIADAAHQIKTPLAGLRTQAELALSETDPEELRRTLQQIVDSSDRAAHMVSQLLSLARMENQRDASRLEALDLAPIARAITGEWVSAAMRKGIDLGFESEDVPAPIAGHPILVREMLNNLIDNALRYTPAGGEITVRLGAGAGAGEVLLEVEDSGRGIPVAERGLVFERFYQVAGTLDGGSGLGLPIVREIVEQHHATIGVSDGGTSDHPTGTRMTIRFPGLDASETG